MKLTKKEVIEILEYVESKNKRFYGRKALAEKYNVSEYIIKTAVNYLTYTKY